MLERIVSVNTSTTTVESERRFFKKMKIYLPKDLYVPFLAISPKTLQFTIDMYSSVSIAALFIIKRNCQQPTCPPTDEWTMKMWNIYTMEYDSAIKKMKFVCKWMEIETLILNEVTQNKKHKALHVFYYAWMFYLFKL